MFGKKKKNKVKKKGRGLSRLAWWVSILLPLGLIFKALHYPGSDLFLIIATLLASFFFVPIFYIKNWKELKKAYSNRFMLILQAFGFFLIPWSNLFILQNYPGAGFMRILLIPEIILIVLSFFALDNIKVKRPIVLATFTIIPVLGLNVFINEIKRNNYKIAIRPILAEIAEQNQKIEADTSILLNESDVQFLTYIDSFEQAVIHATMELDSEPTEQFLSKEALANNDQLHEYDKISYALIGEDPTNPKNTKFSSLELKRNLTKYLESVNTNYIKDIKEIQLFQTDSVKVWSDGSQYEDWEVYLFYHVPIGDILVKTQTLKYFVSNAAKARQFNESVGFSYVENTLTPELLQYQDQSYKAVEKYMSSGAQGSFVSLMGLSCILIIAIFYVPTFNISEKWKKRILFFIVVIIFEYVLLVMDYFVGIYSSGVEVILGVNVLLALGLVTLDNFLRENLLSWYQD